MDKEYLIEKYKELGFNDISIEYLVDATQDCIDVLGDYITVEEIISKVSNNLKNNIEFSERTDGNKGEYKYEERKQ